MMRRSFWSAGLVLVLGVSACGSAVTKQGTSVVVHTPERLVAATADATTRAKTARVALSMSVNSPDLPRTVAIDMNGALAFDGSRADFTMNLGAVLPTAGANATVEVRMVGNTLYYDMAPFVGALGKSLGALPPSLRGVKWLKLDATGLSSSASNSPAQYTQYLDFLRGASKNHVSTVGRQTIRGTATTHYRAQLKPADIVAADKKRIANMRGALRSVMQKGIDQLAKIRTPITADVWIDDHDMARRFEMKMPPIDVSVNSQTITESVSIRMDFYDFGTPVDVQAPPPSEVRDFSSLTGSFGTPA